MTRDRAVGPLLTVRPEAHLLAGLWRRAARDPNGVALVELGPGGARSIDAIALRTAVLEAAAGLISLGVQPGDRVAVRGSPGLRGVVADRAVLAAGGVVVPIDTAASPAQLSHLLVDSGARVVLLESRQDRSSVVAMAVGLASIDVVLALEGDGLERLRRRGRGFAGQVQQRLAALDASTLAVLPYTAGTTGAPRGIELTHGALAANAAQLAARLPGLLEPGGRVLPLLPMAHVLMRTQLQAAIDTGAVVVLPDPQAPELDQLRRARPTLLVATPRVYGELVDAVRDLIDEDLGAAEQDRRRLAELGAGDPGPAVVAHRSPVRWARQHRQLTRLRRHLGTVTGGQLRVGLVGRAALPSPIGSMMAGLGVPLLEVYGLSEAAPLVTVPVVGRCAVGTVGVPLPGTEVLLADDREVLVRGPQVFRGYWGDPTSTARVLRDGWLATGDLGELDASGALTITGRKKRLLVTSDGSNVVPGALEERIAAHPLVVRCTVSGEGQAYVSAEIVVDPAAVARRVGRPRAAAGADPSRWWDEEVDRRLRAELDRVVAAANREVARTAAIRVYRIVPATTASGSSTASSGAA